VPTATTGGASDRNANMPASGERGLFQAAKSITEDLDIPNMNQEPRRDADHRLTLFGLPRVGFASIEQSFIQIDMPMAGRIAASQIAPGRVPVYKAASINRRLLVSGWIRPIRHWFGMVANSRWHATTRRVVNEAFAEEKNALQALPLAPSQAALRLERRVSHEGMVCIGGNSTVCRIRRGVGFLTFTCLLIPSVSSRVARHRLRRSKAAAKNVST
jgi:hypothetical protein